jgi:acyl carrier protein
VRHSQAQTQDGNKRSLRRLSPLIYREVLAKVPLQVFAGLEISLPLSPSPRARAETHGRHTNFSLRAPAGRREPAMDDVAEKIIAILRKNMRDQSKEVTLDTKLTDLEIESLDLAVIVFDIEDTFNIQIPYNANEEVQDFATVGSVVERVKAVLAGSQASNAA